MVRQGLADGANQPWHIANVHLPFRRERADRLQEHRGKDVLFGVRPEHLTRVRAREGETRTGLAAVLPVTFDLIQPTDSRSYGTFKLAGTEVTAELQAHDAEKPGEQMELHVDMSRAGGDRPAK